MQTRLPPIRELVKLSTMYKYPVIGVHISKAMMCRTSETNMTLNRGSISPITHKQQGW